MKSNRPRSPLALPTLSLVVVASLFAACATGTEAGTSPGLAPDDPDATRAASTIKADGASSSMEAGDDTADVDATASDGADLDASAAVDQAAQDAAPSDGPVYDRGDPDTGPDPADASDAADATDGPIVVMCDDAGTSSCVPTGGNFATCATATASSTDSPAYVASRVIDGDLTTSWYAAMGACPAGSCSGTSIYVDVDFDVPRTVGRIKLFGNRDALEEGYDVLKARFQLLDASGNVLYSVDVNTDRSYVEPNGDAEHVLAAPVPCVKKVRVISLKVEDPGSGFGELQVFAN